MRTTCLVQGNTAASLILHTSGTKHHPACQPCYPSFCCCERSPARPEHSALQVHRAILALHSPVFRQMFTHSMTERTSGAVAIDGVSAEAVEAMLMWMYDVTPKVHSTALPELFTLSQR